MSMKLSRTDTEPREPRLCRHCGRTLWGVSPLLRCADCSTPLLMIRPVTTTSEPVIDDLTRRMTVAWRCRLVSEHSWRGSHVCVCRVWSDNHDHWVGPDFSLLTNSLCIHYLVYHRSDVPEEELAKVRTLGCGEAEPTADEIKRPKILGGGGRESRTRSPLPVPSA